MAEEKELNDVPNSEVEQVMEDFAREGCSPVIKVKQPNGLWTVKATCPDR
jgi:hypothetical protein